MTDSPRKRRKRRTLTREERHAIAQALEDYAKTFDETNDQMTRLGDEILRSHVILETSP